MSRIGQVFLFETCLAVVTEGPGPETALRLDTPWRRRLEPVQVCTFAVLHDSGEVEWPAWRYEDTLAVWEANGRRAL